MNQPANPSPQQPECAAPAAPAPLVDPNLGVALQHDHDAILHDLREAKRVAATLEQQLAGKSKEVMHLKFLLEQTKTNLAHMQDGIAAMRKERHKLANTAMRTPVMDVMLARVTTERDQLRAELNRVLERPAVAKAAGGLYFDKRDHQIADLTTEVFALRQEMAALHRVSPPPAPFTAEPSPTSPVSEARFEESTHEGVEMDTIAAEPVSVVQRKA